MSDKSAAASANAPDGGGPLSSKQVAAAQLKSSTLVVALGRTAAGLPTLPSREKKGGSKTPKAHWVMPQFIKATAEQLRDGHNPNSGWCKHCTKDFTDLSELRALDNITRLGEHLLNPKKCRFCDSDEARELAKTVAVVRELVNVRSMGPVRPPSEISAGTQQSDSTPITRPTSLPSPTRTGRISWRGWTASRR
jgi:hypothetical protein